MPVINLPRDTRWSELGTALGGALEKVVGAYTQKQQNEEIARIMASPEIAEADKPKEIIKKYGLDVYGNFVKTQVLQSQAKENAANALLKTAQASASGDQDEISRALFGLPARKPVAAPTAASPTVDVLSGQAATPPQAAPASPSTNATVSALGGTPTPAAPTPAATAPAATPVGRMIDQRAEAGKVVLSEEEKAALMLQVAAHVRASRGGAGLSDIMAPVDKYIKAKQEGAAHPSAVSKAASEATTAAAGAQVSEARSQVDLKKAQQELDKLKTEAPYVKPKAEATTQSAINAAKATTPAGTTSAQVGDVYSSFTPEQNAAVATAAQTKGAGAASELIAKFVADNTAAARSGDAARSQRVAEVENRTRTFTQVMDDIETNPRLNGGIQAALVNPILARYGYDFGLIPPESYGEMGTASQLALQALQGHRGFGGSYLVKAVAETMPTAAKQKLFKAIETNFQAQQDVVELESLKRAAQDKGQATGQLDTAIEKARELERRTGTLWWTGDKRVFFKGREINPDTWVAVEGGAREFAPKDYLRVREGTSMTGAEINQLARESGQTPEQILARLRAQSGTLPQQR